MCSVSRGAEATTARAAFKTSGPVPSGPPPGRIKRIRGGRLARSESLQAQINPDACSSIERSSACTRDTPLRMNEMRKRRMHAALLSV